MSPFQGHLDRDDKKLNEVRHKHLLDVLKYLKTQKRDFDFLIRHPQEEYKQVKKSFKQLNKIGEVKHQFKHIPYFLVRLSGEDAQNLYDLINQKASKRITKKYSSLDNLIDSIEAPFRFSKQDYQLDDFNFPKTYAGYQAGQRWNLKNIMAYDAQEITKGANTNIAILDTGVDYDHPELSSRFGHNKGENFTGPGAPLDRNGHGTHVAGICAGETTGVAPEATLYAVKVLDDGGHGTDYEIILGLEWAIDNDIEVVNMSLGAPSATHALEEVCRMAKQKGIALVAAAGNDGFGPSYPASFDSVISVAAVDEANEHAYFSNIYNTTEISAPGVDIVSTYPGGQYYSMSGTSMASPHITGAIALYLSRAEPNKKQEYRERLSATAFPLFFDSEYPNEWIFGAGLVQADELVKSTLSGLLNNVYAKTRYLKGYDIENKIDRLKAHISKRHNKMKRTYGAD